MRPVEILVHVSAPSRGRDDARYRTEARGFLDFEPVGKHLFLGLENEGRSEAEEGVPSLRGTQISYPPRTDTERDSHRLWGPRKHGKDEAVRVDETTNMIQRAREKEEYGKDGKKVEKNGESNLSGMRDAHGSSKGVHDVEETHSSLESLPGKRNDAEENLSRVQIGFRTELLNNHTPLRQPAAVFGGLCKDIQGRAGKSSKTPPPTPNTNTSALPLTSVVKETPRLLIERTPALPRRRTAPTAATPSQQAPPLRRTRSDSWQTPPSTIPDSQPHVPSYHLPEMTSSPCLKRPFQSSSPSPTRPSPPRTKKPRLQIPSSPPNETPAPEGSRLPPASPSSAPAAPLTSPSPPPTHISSSPPFSTPNANPLEIHPPYPEPSTARFSTHLTPSLTDLAAQLATCYPKFKKTQTRTIHPLERGHWLIPFTTQDPTFQNDLWEFLHFYITSGRAGWGVWAVREEANAHKCACEKCRDTCIPKSTSSEKEELLKVYCWGEVVAEVWLIMYMGGKRKIKGVGSAWIDAGGEAVVVMK